MGVDAQSLIIEEIKSRLNFPSAKVKLVWVEESIGPITFGRNQAVLIATSAALLDRAGDILRQQPTLNMQIDAGAEGNERGGMAYQRARAIAEYLASKWGIAGERMTLNSSADAGRGALLKVKLAEGNAEQLSSRGAAQR
jgi:hypothetical protein